MTQEKTVLMHLKSYNPRISPMEAMKLYGIMRLAAVIFELRQKGYVIQTHRKQSSPQPHKWYAEYELISEPETSK